MDIKIGQRWRLVNEDEVTITGFDKFDSEAPWCDQRDDWYYVCGRSYTYDDYGDSYDLCTLIQDAPSDEKAAQPFPPIFEHLVPSTEAAAIGEQFNADRKETNPKDAIGARKVPMSVIPAGVLFEIALGMLEGSAKYGRHNYRVMGVRASVYYDAAMGHLMDWWEGEDIDGDYVNEKTLELIPGSDLSHVTKAITSLIVLRDAMLQGKLTDDRPPRSAVLKRDFNEQAGAIIDRHADKAPHHYTINDEVEK